MTSSPEPQSRELKTKENPESDASPVTQKSTDKLVDANQGASQPEVEYWSK